MDEENSLGERFFEVYPAGNLFIPAPHGRLEAILKEPRPQARGAALVLHPHPQHGGTMHNKVVFRAARGLEDAGFATLRINFRGVGQSTGEYGYGIGEQEDARVALDFLADRYAALPLIVAGFSFGSRVGLEVGLRDDRVRALIAIGTPVNMYDFSFLRACRKPILFVHGELDEFGSVESLRSLVAELPLEAHAQLRVVPGVGHFFDDKVDEVRRIIAAWAARQGAEQVVSPSV